jgi:hypothetical protein
MPLVVRSFQVALSTSVAASLSISKVTVLTVPSIAMEVAHSVSCFLMWRLLLTVLSVARNGSL